MNNTILKNGLVSLVLSIIACFSACKKETTNPNTYIAKEYYDYKFKAGTYWVYENNVTHEIDSQYVDSLKYGVNAGSVGFKYPRILYSEEYDCKISDYFNGRKYAADLDLQGAGIGIGHFNYRTQKLGTIPVLSTNDPLTYTGYIDSVIILDFAFTNVYKNKITSVLDYDSVLNHDNEFWFAPKYGIVKRIEYGTFNGDVEWNLKRWHINL